MNRRECVALILPLLAAIAVHCTILLASPGGSFHFTRDSTEYLAAADNLKSTGVLYAGDRSAQRSEELYSRRPPAFPVFILLAQMFGNGAAPIILFQLLLNGAGYLLLVRILSRLGLPFPYRIAAGCLYLFLPAQILYTQKIMSEILFQTLLLVMLYLIVTGYTRTGRFFLFHIVLTLAILTKPVAVVLCIPAILFSLYTAVKERRPALVAAAIIPLAVMGAWGARNLERTGLFHYSSISTAALRDYTTYLFVAERRGTAAAESTTAAIRMGSAGLPFDRSTAVTESLCVQVLAAHPVPYALFHVRGMLAFFIDPGRYDVAGLAGDEGGRGFLHKWAEEGVSGVWAMVGQMSPVLLLYLAVMLAANIVLLAGVFLFAVRNYHIPMLLRVYIPVALGFIALATGPLGASRFRLPVFPYLLVATACAANGMRRNREPSSQS